MYLSPSTPTASQPVPQLNGEQAHAGPSRGPPLQQQNQWQQQQPPSPYSPMMQPQQPNAYYAANGGQGAAGWAGGNRIPQPPRYHDYPPQQQQPQGYYPPGAGYYPSYQQRPQHPQQAHPSQQAMSHLHYHPIQPQYPMPPVQPQPQPPPVPAPESAPSPSPAPALTTTSSTPLNPAAQGFTFNPRPSTKPAPPPVETQGPVYASVAHPPSYNPAPIPPHVAMMYPSYPMPMMMGMNPYQQMHPYQYPLPQHYQQHQQQPMLSPIPHQMPPPASELTSVSTTASMSASVAASSPPTAASPALSAVGDEPASVEQAQATPTTLPTPLEKETAVEVEAAPAPEPTTPQPSPAPYTYLPHPSPSTYAYLVSPYRPSDPTSAPAMSFGTRTSMPQRVREQATAWKGDVASAKHKRKEKTPGLGMVFSVGVGKEQARKVQLVFGTVTAEPEPEVKEEKTELEGKQAEVVEEVKADFEAKADVEKVAKTEAKTIPSTPSAAQTPASVPSPSGTNGVAEPKAAPVKPSSWAALVRNKPSASTPVSATASASTSKPASPAPESPVEPEAGPSKLNGSAGASPAGSTPAPARPVFNYAAAAASGSTTRSPAEEFARLLSEGIWPEQGGKGKGRERTVTIPRGLVNMGNMCFANSILQVLVFCTPFAQLFEELGKRLKADLARRTPLVEAMIIFLREFTVTSASVPNGGEAKPLPTQNMEPFLPTNVYEAMKLNKRFDSMRRGHQEDAEEFLGFFLNTLHEELLLLHARIQPASTNGVKSDIAKPVANGDHEEREVERPVSPGADGDDGWLEVGKKQKTNVVRNTESRESAVSRIFGGKLRSVLHTPGQKDSVTLEPYQPLQLDIQHPAVLTITDALRHINEPEVVPGVWSVSRGANVDATKQVYIETLPPCLILHLKRFVYDAKEHQVVKKSKPVAYGTELVIPPEIISPARRTSQATKYKLFGIIFHHGSTASGGHYTAVVARQDGSGWLHLDDESIEPVPTDQVVVSRDAAIDGKAGEVGTSRREKCAYLAFYQRV